MIKKTDDQELRAALAAKQAECDRLYRLVNRYKQQITDLDIELVTRDQIIEEMRGQLAAREEGEAA